MIQLNDIKISGNLARDPEVTMDGPVKFSIGCNEKYKNKKGESCVETSFFDVVCWGPVGAACLDLPKGFPVLIEGRLKQEAWKDKETGANRYKVLIIASRVHWLAPKDQARDDSNVAQVGPRVPSAASRINAPVGGSNPHKGDDSEPPFRQLIDIF